MFKDLFIYSLMTKKTLFIKNIKLMNQMYKFENFFDKIKC